MEPSYNECSHWQFTLLTGQKLLYREKIVQQQRRSVSWPIEIKLSYSFLSSSSFVLALSKFVFCIDDVIVNLLHATCSQQNSNIDYVNINALATHAIRSMLCRSNLLWHFLLRTVQTIRSIIVRLTSTFSILLEFKNMKALAVCEDSRKKSPDDVLFSGFYSPERSA